MTETSETELPPTILFEPEKMLVRNSSGLYILSNGLAEEANSYLKSVIEKNLIPNPNKKIHENNGVDKTENRDESLMKNPHLKAAYVLPEDIGVLHGSNTFGQAALNPFLREKGYQVADLSQVVKALVPNELGSYNLTLRRTFKNSDSRSPEYFRPAIVDFGVVISEQSVNLDSLLTGNDFIRSELLGLLSEHGDYKLPLLISPGSLEAVFGLFRDTGYGFLYLKLTDNPKIISNPILNERGFFSLEDLDEATGLPKKLRAERRYKDDIDETTGVSRKIKPDIKEELDLPPSEFEFIPPKPGVGISRAYIYTTYPSFNLDYTHFSNSNWHGKTVLVRK